MNTAYDPLRDDPFAAAPQPTPVAITTVQSAHPNTQWGLEQQGPHGSHGQQHAQLASPGDHNDILLQFNNTNISAAPVDVTQGRRRRADSHASGASSIGSRSAQSGSRNNVLDNMAIAPPPEQPIGKDYTLSAFNAEFDLSPRPPPNWDLIKHSGFILARISMRTLVMKVWKRTFWIAYGDHTLFFFKTRDHFESWAMDPNLSGTQRDDLVKLCVDFRHPSASTRKDTEKIKGFQASAVKGKYYKSNGNLYQFKLDKWTDQGPTINAAFASANAEDVRELHLITAAMIRNSPSAAILEYTDARSAGDDSSGYFSAGSNPTFARASGSDDRSAYSARSYKSQNSARSARSGGSTGGSKTKYAFNNVMAKVSQSIQR